MFVSTAYAQSLGQMGGGTDMLVQFAPLILIFVVFYFLLIRPQQRKMKDHQAMLGAVRRGDRIVTGGGILATVIKVGPDDELQVEIAENVRVRVLRATVNMVLAKTEPANASAPKAATETTGETPPPPAGEDGGVIKNITRLFGRK